MKTLLKLQKLDLKIEACRARERAIPKQKRKFEIQRERLTEEAAQREQAFKDLQVEQQDCESEIDQFQAQIDKYNQQLNAVKKNEEYQALLHEIDGLKKHIGKKEERILGIMDEIEDAKARLDEDKIRIKGEQDTIDGQCKEIDKELEEAVHYREELQAQGAPLMEQIDGDLFQLYTRIRESKKSGAAAVPMKNEVCGGCHMYLRPQIVNEILAGINMHTCQHCGRLLFHPDNFADEEQVVG